MKEKFTTLLKTESFIPISHGMSNDEMFKDMISNIIQSSKFDIENLNNKNCFFICKKICFKGNHIGYSSNEKKDSSFVYRENQNKYQSTDFFLVEFKHQNY